MRVRGGLLAATIALVLSACASLNVNDPEAVTAAISVRRDEFEKLTEYIGPNAVPYSLAQWFWPDKVLIRAWKGDALEALKVALKDDPDAKDLKSTIYQIYVEDSFVGDWRFYNSAYDANGNRLNTTLISRDVGCRGSSCQYVEQLGLEITREYLEKNKETGIRFKISGKFGENIFFIPSGYIKAFLSVVK